ncbi:MAG: hypothetical protein K2X31_08835 [Sphingopyxis sp.]|nr:hypothetical protein [Sphingopyxis sp.]
MAIPRTLIGGAAALLMATGGFFLWQGLSETPDPASEALPPPEALPVADASLVGAPPPDPPEARAATREERRFQRHDRNRDGIITRVEMMSSRTAAFRRLDTDGNNLLSFEEWAVATGNRFAQADKDRSGSLDAPEFATTAPPRRPRSECRC